MLSVDDEIIAAPQIKFWNTDMESGRFSEAWLRITENSILPSKSAISSTLATAGSRKISLVTMAYSPNVGHYRIPLIIIYNLALYDPSRCLELYYAIMMPMPAGSCK